MKKPMGFIGFCRLLTAFIGPWGESRPSRQAKVFAKRSAKVSIGQHRARVSMSPSVAFVILRNSLVSNALTHVPRAALKSDALAAATADSG
jgi:hypothetical protein